MENAFNEYLTRLETIENVLSFEIEKHDVGSLIDDIFLNIDNANRLFGHKFNRRLL